MRHIRMHEYRQGFTCTRVYLHGHKHIKYKNTQPPVSPLRCSVRNNAYINVYKNEMDSDKLCAPVCSMSVNMSLSVCQILSFPHVLILHDHCAKCFAIKAV